MKLIREETNNFKILGVEDVYKYLKEFVDEDREMFIVLGLSTKNTVLYREIVSVGILNASIVHPRETFKKAIMMSCDKIIIALHHPSGDPNPSSEDLEVKKIMKNAGDILSIKVLDFIIIGTKGYWSDEMGEVVWNENDTSNKIKGE